MGGVDRSDQMISYTNNVVKSFKWWKKVFFHVLAITVLDAYILFCTDHPNDNMTHKLFRKQLVSQLVSNNPANTVNKVGRPSVAQLERLTAKHFISKLRGTGKKTMLAIQFKKGNGQVMKPPMNAKTVMSHFVLSPVSNFIILIRSMYLLKGGGRSLMQHQMRNKL